MNGGRRSRGTRGNVFRLGDNVSIFLLGVLSLTGMIVVTLSLVGRDHKTSPIHLYVGGQGLLGGVGVGGCGPCLLFFCLLLLLVGEQDMLILTPISSFCVASGEALAMLLLVLVMMDTI